MRITTLLLFVVASVFSSYAQAPSYQAVKDIPFFQQGRRLPAPLTGGLEAPQFAEMHLNGDDIADLLVFDRVGAKALPFTAYPTPEGVNYRYAPEYEAALPPLSQMAKVADLNCDGLADLLTTEAVSSAADVALKAYLRQPTPDGGLAFQPRQVKLLNHPDDSLVRIHAFDLPALDDINGDGRPGLLYIPRGGTQIHYYENATPQGGGCDSLAFELRHDCWGGATYTLEGDFELNSCDPGRLSGCAGSAMLLLDDDGDGDQDLLFSGIYDYHIQLLNNGGGTQVAELNSSSIDWLNSGEELLEFPAPYLLDLEQDGSADLIVATNRINGAGFSPFANRIFHFRQDNGDGSWNLLSNRFMIKEMIDHGFRSSPTVYDVNEDGLPDLLIAYNSAHPIYGYTARIALYLHTGTADDPAFTLTTDDFGMLSIYNLKAIHPALGDLNGDGIPELVLGLENGSLQAYTNSQSAMGQYFPMPSGSLDSIALYGYARPQLIDVDENGTLDLLCGARDGTMAWIDNTGTPSSPQFLLREDTLGGIIPEGFFQECSPYFLKQDNGNFILYYGRRDGTAGLYEGQPGETFTLLTPQLHNVDVGERATVVLHDLNADGIPELIMGNMRGGIEIFEDPQLSATTEPAPNLLRAKAFPNPARTATSIEVEGLNGPATLLLFDMMGRLVHHQDIQPGGSPYRIPLNGLATGLYFYSIHSSGQQVGGKLTIIK